MKIEAGTETTALDGTETITLDETVDGIKVYSMITADGEPAIVIQQLDGKLETAETGTTAADDDAQVVGITTVAGT